MSLTLDLFNFAVQHLRELTLGDTITVEQHTFRLLTTRLVEALEEFLDHVTQIGNHFSAVGLYTDGTSITRSTSIHTGGNSSNGRTVHITRSRMGDISTEDDSRALRDERNLRRRQVQVHAAKLHVDLKTHVGTVLLLGISNVLALDALCRDTND